MNNDPLWYKDAVIYELHVRSFYDSNGDGFGDFEGARQKLPYLEELGVNTIWLLPFYESPLRDDGYDIADYYKVLPVHGTLEDFQRFLDEAHERGMRVLTELVLNHTSDLHPWFQESRKPGSAKRDWYVWSDTPQRFQDTRIIFTDTEVSNWTWDKVAGAYFWHRFFSHQPDLNFDNTEVREAMLEVVYYWLDMGVDGLRLDAVPYLYEREGTNCENLPETLTYISELRQAIDRRYGPGRILLAEANQWPEDTLPYFAEGEGVQMAFNFPLMPRLYLALRREDRRPMIEMLRLTEGIPPNAQWAIFLRNHDELTLEMVTDEERDFMYSEYAADPQFRINVGIRRRLAPLLGGERKRIELMNALLLSLGGSPIIYYGDEIGMGDNPFLGDRNGVRTPMQWSPDRNAGFSRAQHHQLFLPTINLGRYSYEFVNVEDEERDPHSLLNFMRRLIAMRNQHGRTFGRGTLTVLPVKNPKVFAFVREHEDEKILIVINLSRFAQSALLELKDFEGLIPVEMFSKAPFPMIGEEVYHITMSPHNFLWFVLQKEGATPRISLTEPATAEAVQPLPTISVPGGLEEVLVKTMAQGEAREELETLLPAYLQVQRWFGARDRMVEAVHLEDAVRLQAKPFPMYITTIRVTFSDGDAHYVLPLSFARQDEARNILASRPQAGVAWLRGPFGDGLLYDATANPLFWSLLFERMRAGWKSRSLKGNYTAVLTHDGEAPTPGEVRVLSAEQSNSSAILGSHYFAKVFRRLEHGLNPEVEMLRYLTAAGFPFTSKLIGTLEFRQGKEEFAMGVLQEALPAEMDAWANALQEMNRYLERVAQTAPPVQPYPENLDEVIPGWLEEVGSDMIELARLLGVRTAQLHRALDRGEAPAFAPEPTSPDDLKILAERIGADLAATRTQLQEQDRAVGPISGNGAPHTGTIREEAWAHAEQTLDAVRNMPGGWHKIRIHGDFHLGQVLRAGSEYYILDFEGEPARPLAERRQKDQALRDVAGMIRSLEYAGLVAWKTWWEDNRAVLTNDRRESSMTWTWAIIRWCEVAFLSAYFSAAGEAAFLPPEALRLPLLQAYKLDKALYEVRYDLGHRPDWIWVPLTGLDRLLERPGSITIHA